MSTKSQPRFDLDALRELAGAKVFARGQDYHRCGQVEILAIEPGRVLAQVAGTEDYRTVLTGRGKRIDGECSCPAFKDWGICKHMVATALAANEAGEMGEAEGAGALARIRDHLKSKGVDVLVEMIVELAEHDAALFRKLDLAAAAVQADDKTLEARIRKAINGATRTNGYVDYYEASDWAAEVESTLDPIADLVSAGRAELALTLVEHAIGRIERVAEEVDGSDGHCVALLERAGDIHFEACRAVRPDPVQLARDLFAREMADDYDTFYRAAARYNAVLGEAGLAEYRRLVVEAWEKLPPRAGGGGVQHEFAIDYYRLKEMLDFFAERDGDLEARIALRAKDLSSPRNYLELAEFCLAHERQDEALRYAEEGLWIFEDERPDERLVLFAAELLSKAGRKGDAEAQLWCAFEKAPSLQLYERLRKLGGTAARDRAIAQLEKPLAPGKSIRWRSPAGLLIELLMVEKMFDAAWAAVRKYRAPVGLEESLAKACEATHPAEALEVYAKRVEQLVTTGGNPCYEEAAGLIARMASLRNASEQTVYIVDLKRRHHRKRNFMKLLG